jgi:hypothetical protein
MSHPKCPEASRKCDEGIDRCNLSEAGCDLETYVGKCENLKKILAETEHCPNCGKKLITYSGKLFRYCGVCMDFAYFDDGSWQDFNDGSWQNG